VIGDTDVARAHIRLQCDAQGVLVTDIGSGKGTWVNGIACQDGETFRILSGTDIQLGRTRVSLSWNETDGAPA
jgi:pSer/pThr/pTyr-binding forkhead associated (FHA) protein